MVGVEEKEGVQEAPPLHSPVAGPAGGAQPENAASGYDGAELFDMGACPDCGSGQLAFEEGCKKCHVCGYSECG